MAQIVLELPEELVESLRVEAERAHTTAEALLARHVVSNPPRSLAEPRLSAASFWGAGAGLPGSHGSVEAVDAYIRELRDEWDD